MGLIGDAKYYVTTAIDYVNSKPHIGHAYEKVAADVVARYQRLRGREVFLQVGLDEHSINVARRALELDLTAQAYCDQMAQVYDEFFRTLQIDYRRFIRTSDPDHHAVVQEALLAVAKKGYIYPGKYEGWYCPSCETFYRERDLVNGCCPVHDFLQPQWIVEYNYYFRLSAFAEQIREQFRKHPEWVQPASRRNEILRRLEEGLEDISISRAVTDWGILVPPEINEYVDLRGTGLERNELTTRLQGHRVYVWFDALLNYITGAGYGTPDFAGTWPANLQLVGKDITWFHCVIQPAILLALDLPLPEQIYAHGFIQRDGKRISSSLGNLLYPEEIVQKVGVDPLRYYYFRRVSFGLDGDFTWQDFYETYNTSLANVLGNLVYRSLKMTEKYFGGVIPEPSEPGELEESLAAGCRSAYQEAGAALDALELSAGLQRIEEWVRRINRYIDETTPWALREQERLQTVIYHLLAAIYQAAILLQPFIPGTSAEIIRRLGQDGVWRWPEGVEGAEILGQLTAQRTVEVGTPLFPRYEVPEAVR